MNKKSWIILFLLILVVDLIAVYVENNTIGFIMKPLLMPVLGGFVFSQTIRVSSSFRTVILLALFFSWAGDILLMFEPVYKSYFTYGLIAFLLAHIFYIIFYELIIRREQLKKNFWLFIPVLIYYVILISVLSPGLGNMKMPVRIYGAVISYMLIQAFQTARMKNKSAAGLIISGSLMFLLSDSLLALNKFYQPINRAQILVMLTYGLAQLLITIGAIRYITSASKQ